MLLNELMDNKIDFEVDQQNDHRFQTIANIGDRQILFVADLINKEHSMWDVSFIEKKNGEYSHKQTHSGKAFDVMSMVKDSMLMFVKKYRPQTIKFYATKESNKSDHNARSSVYERMLKRFKLKGYEVEVDKTSQASYFTLEKIRI